MLYKIIPCFFKELYWETNLSEVFLFKNDKSQFSENIKKYVVSRKSVSNEAYRLYAYISDQYENLFVYKIIKGSNVIFQDSIIYKTEREALLWFFSGLEVFGSQNYNIVFPIEFALYNILKQHDSSDNQFRKMLLMFSSFYKRYGNNLKILMEIQSLGDIDECITPKELSTRFLLKAPLLSGVIIDFFNNSSRLTLENLTELANKISY